jgi:hypothetical protein
MIMPKLCQVVRTLQGSTKGFLEATVRKHGGHSKVDAMKRDPMGKATVTVFGDADIVKVRTLWQPAHAAHKTRGPNQHMDCVHPCISTLLAPPAECDDGVRHVQVRR